MLVSLSCQRLIFADALSKYGTCGCCVLTDGGVGSVADSGRHVSCARRLSSASARAVSASRVGLYTRFQGFDGCIFRPAFA